MPGMIDCHVHLRSDGLATLRSARTDYPLDIDQQRHRNVKAQS